MMNHNVIIKLFTNAFYLPVSRGGGGLRPPLTLCDLSKSDGKSILLYV